MRFAFSYSLRFEIVMLYSLRFEMVKFHSLRLEIRKLSLITKKSYNIFTQKKSVVSDLFTNRFLKGNTMIIDNTNKVILYYLFIIIGGGGW